MMDYLVILQIKHPTKWLGHFLTRKYYLTSDVDGIICKSNLLAHKGTISIKMFYNIRMEYWNEK
jgi:hypothetical protein